MKTADAFYLKQFFYTFSIPLLIVGSIFSWSIIYILCARRMKFTWIQIKHRMILTMTLLTFLCYPMLVKLCLGMLKCPYVDGIPYLMADLQEPCYQDRHSLHLMLLTVPQLILYVFGKQIDFQHGTIQNIFCLSIQPLTTLFFQSILIIFFSLPLIKGLPVFASALILRNKDILYSRKFYTRYGLLYLGYREGREWWEGVIAIRKIGIVAIGTFGTLMGVVDLQAFIALGKEYNFSIRFEL